MGYSKCMGKDESLFRRMWDVICSIILLGKEGLGVHGVPKELLLQQGVLEQQQARANPAPHVEQLCQM